MGVARLVDEILYGAERLGTAGLLMLALGMPLVAYLAFRALRSHWRIDLQWGVSAVAAASLIVLMLVLQMLADDSRPRTMPEDCPEQRTAATGRHPPSGSRTRPCRTDHREPAAQDGAADESASATQSEPRADQVKDAEFCTQEQQPP